MSRLWDKGQKIDDLMLTFTVGNDNELDERLVRHDIRASLAHAEMLKNAGHLSADDLTSITEAFDAIGAAHAQGEWHINQDEEDCHTALEARLIAAAGEAGERIHLGRSRNDQVLAALRLYMLAASNDLIDAATEVAASLDTLAESQGAILLPGYTHMQRAMPSSVALWAGGYATEIRDDIGGLKNLAHRISRNPLGSAAGYGTPGCDIDREATARSLQFKSVQSPVTAVQLSRGKAEASLVFEIALLMKDLGRLAADLCLFATTEFGFVKLPDSMTTGSSIMPQKRNPDVFELIRARAARAPSRVQEIMALTAGLTSGYHRDLQLIKEPLFASIDDALATLTMMAHAVRDLRFVAKQTESAMDSSLNAAERANRLVQNEGITFREAYRRIAKDL